MIMLRGQNNSVQKNQIEDMKKSEAPEFDKGKLLRRKPIRHKIPKHNFYYSNEEWFDENNEINNKQDKNTCTTSSKSPKNTCTLPEINNNNKSTNLTSLINNNEITDPEKDFNSSEYKKYTIKIPTKVYADSYIRRDAAKWKSTPVPGSRTCTYYDQYRTEALKHYDVLYNKKKVWFLNMVDMFQV
jgi:hypothetical protein